MRIAIACAVLALQASPSQAAFAAGLGHGVIMAAEQPHGSFGGIEGPGNRLSRDLMTEVFFRGGFHGGGLLRGAFRNHVMGRFGGGGGFRGGGGYGWGGVAAGAAVGVGVGAAAGAAATSAYQSSPYPYGYAYPDD